MKVFIHGIFKYLSSKDLSHTKIIIHHLLPLNQIHDPKTQSISLNNSTFKYLIHLLFL